MVCSETPQLPLFRPAKAWGGLGDAISEVSGHDFPLWNTGFLCPLSVHKRKGVESPSHCGPSFLLPVPLMLCDQDDSGFDVRCLMSSPGSTYCPSLWLQILLVKWGQDPFFRFPRRSKEIKCFVSHEVLPTRCFLHPFLFGWPCFFPSQAQVLLLYNHPHTHCKA